MGMSSKRHNPQCASCPCEEWLKCVYPAKDLVQMQLWFAKIKPWTKKERRPSFKHRNSNSCFLFVHTHTHKKNTRWVFCPSTTNKAYLAYTPNDNSSSSIYRAKIRHVHEALWLFRLICPVGPILTNGVGKERLRLWTAFLSSFSSLLFCGGRVVDGDWCAEDQKRYSLLLQSPNTNKNSVFDWLFWLAGWCSALTIIVPRTIHGPTSTMTKAHHNKQKNPLVLSSNFYLLITTFDGRFPSVGGINTHKMRPHNAHLNTKNEKKTTNRSFQSVSSTLDHSQKS